RGPGKERYVSAIASAGVTLATVSGRHRFSAVGGVRVLRPGFALLERSRNPGAVRPRVAVARTAGRADGGARDGLAGPLSEPFARQLARPVYPPGGRLRVGRQRAAGAVLRLPARLHQP